MFLILRCSIAVAVAQSQHVCCIDVAVVRCCLKQLHSLAIVLCASKTLVEHKARTVPASIRPGLCPFYESIVSGCEILLLATFSQFVYHTKIVVSVTVSVFSSFFEPANSLFRILLRPNAFHISESKRIHGVCHRVILGGIQQYADSFLFRIILIYTLQHAYSVHNLVIADSCITSECPNDIHKHHKCRDAAFA